MARPLRIEYEGALYHVTSRGNEKREIYYDIADRRRMMHLFDVGHKRYGVIIHAFTFMSNHYHHLPETPHGNLSRMMHDVNCSYTVYFNRKYDRAGHLFQGRYRAILVQKEEYLLELVRYISLNPVRAGLVEEPEDYPWSSMKYYVGLATPPPWLDVDYILSRFGRRKKEAMRGFKRFVMQGLDKGNPLDSAYAGSILGEKQFIDETKKKCLEGSLLDSNILHSRKLMTRVNLDDVKKAVEVIQASEGKIQFPGKTKRGNIGPKMFVYLARRYTDSSLRDIGNILGAISSSAVQKCKARFENDLKGSTRLQAKVLAAEKIMGLSPMSRPDPKI